MLSANTSVLRVDSLSAGYALRGTGHALCRTLEESDSHCERMWMFDGALLLCDPCGRECAAVSSGWQRWLVSSLCGATVDFQPRAWVTGL